MKLHCYGCQQRLRFFQVRRWIRADGYLRPFHGRCSYTWLRVYASLRRIA